VRAALEELERHLRVLAQTPARVDEATSGKKLKEFLP
jgi:hypothetical protein